MAQKLLTLEEAAARLGVSSDELMQLVEQRKVFAIKDGGSWKFKAEEIDRYKASASDPGSMAFYLPIDNDEEGDDPGLVTDATVGGSSAGQSGSTIIRPGSGDQVLSGDSDLSLGSGSGSGSDSDVKLVADDLDTSGSGSGLKLVPSQGTGGGSGSDLQMVDLDSGTDTFKLRDDNDATVEAKPGSGIKGGKPGKSGIGKSGKPGSSPKLGGGSDLTISESGLALGDDDITIGGSSSAHGMNSSKLNVADEQFEDDDIVLGGSSGGSGIGDSGINLAAAADSGLSLEEPLELGGDDGVSDSSGSDEVDMASDDDFLLTPMLELDDQDSSDSSGSQVIALDTENVDDQAATLLGGDLLGGAAMTSPANQAMGPGPMGMQMVPAQPQAQYSGLWIGVLIASFLVLSLTGMMMFEMIKNIWHWGGTSAPSAAIMDALIKMFEG